MLSFREESADNHLFNPVARAAQIQAVGRLSHTHALQIEILNLAIPLSLDINDTAESIMRKDLYSFSAELLTFGVIRTESEMSVISCVGSLLKHRLICDIKHIMIRFLSIPTFFGESCCICCAFLHMMFVMNVTALRNSYLNGLCILIKYNYRRKRKLIVREQINRLLTC